MYTSLPLRYQYALALAVITLAVMAAVPLAPVLHGHLAYTVPLAAITLIAWMVEIGPAFAALVAGAVMSNYLFTEPLRWLPVYDPEDQVSLLITYLFCGSVGIFLFHFFREKRRGVEQSLGKARAEEREAKDARDRIAGVLGSITDCYLRVDSVWRLVDLNEQTARYLNLSRDAVLGKNMWDVFEGAAGSIIESKLREAFVTGRPTHFEAVCGHSRTRSAEIHAYPSSGGLEVYFRDISDRKQAEQRIADLNEVLQLRLGELRTLLDTIPVGIAIAEGTECDTIHPNPALCRLLQVPADTDLAGNLGHAAMSQGSRSIDIRELLRDCLKGAVAGNSEYEIMREDGSSIKVLGSTAPLLDRDGRPRGAVAVFLDITSLKTVEAQLKQAKERAESNAVRSKCAEEKVREADRRKDEFLAMLAHELRNPLAAISAAVTLLNMPQSGQRMVAIRESLQQRMQQVCRLVDDLLDISRITRGKIELRKGPVDLAAVVQHAVESLRGQIEQRHQVLVVRTAVRSMIFGDVFRLEQVVGNLLSNAVKYTCDGGRIEIETFEHHGAAVIKVRDTGIGIDPAFHKHIFEPFAQISDRKRSAQGGLGLGLSMVQSLVRMHGGEVKVFSEGRGRGTEFTVRLPIGRQERVRPEQRTEKLPEVRPGLQILLVEDNKDTAYMVAEKLKAEGHYVDLEQEGHAALAAAGRNVYDVVLLDIGLPDIDGYEVGRRLRQDPRMGAPLLIAVTGFGTESDRILAKEAGFDYHFTKPVQYEDLVPALATWQSSRRALAVAAMRPGGESKRAET